MVISPQKYEPVSLQRGQFGLIAFVSLFAAWIPIAVSIAPATHVTEVDIGQAAMQSGSAPLLVEILATSAIRVNQRDIALIDLMKLSDKMAMRSRHIVLKPQPCAPYDMVLKAVVVLKRSSVSFAFADPDYSTSFGKSDAGTSRESRRFNFGAECINR